MIQRASSLGHEAALTPVAGAAPPKYFGQDADAILINSFQALPLDAALASGRRCAVRLIDSFADAGADIIHGHHPHVWQNYEIYKDKPIFYSFGNFIFDQSWSAATSHSQIAALTLTKSKIVDLKLFPIEINFNSQPRLIQ